jgi:polyisoprenoid-binding protein YceI
MDFVKATLSLRQSVTSLASLAAAFTLFGCAELPPASPGGETGLAQSERPALQTVYAALGETDGKVFTLDPDQSAVRIHVFRGGQAAKAGHNHVLSAPHFTGFFYLPRSGPAAGRFDLEFRLDQLEVDNPAYRAVLGSAFSSSLSAQSIERLRANMLGAGNLQADRFPLVRVQSLRIIGEPPKFAARVRIELHGQSRELWIPLTVEGLPDHLSVSGAFVLRQTDFGVQPYSAMGGLLAVRDEVVVEFNLIGG